MNKYISKMNYSKKKHKKTHKQHNEKQNKIEQKNETYDIAQHNTIRNRPN